MKLTTITGSLLALAGWLAGDEIVEHPLSVDELNACRVLLVPDRENLLAADRRLIERRAEKGSCCTTVSEALAQMTPAVGVEPAAQVRALARVKPGSAVIHLLNYQYDAARDDVKPLDGVKLRLDLTALGVAAAKTCRWVPLDAEPSVLPVDDGTIKVPALGLWGLLVLGDE